MSTSTETTPGSIAPGKILFYDSIQPPLSAGDYTLEATQEIQDLIGVPAKSAIKSNGEAATDNVPTYQAKQKFRIDGPRFKIDPSLIHMTFPPANHEGTYFDVLPHIVFKNFALPWARNINPEGGADKEGSSPWMALLTIYPNEMPDPSQPDRPVKGVKTVSIADIVKPPSTIIGPKLGDDVDTTSDEKILVMDMDYAFFRGIAPRLTELALLAHAREVNTGGKVMLGLDEDGCFSVVVGNRVAKSGTGTEPVTNTVFLVSLEGHQEHLPGAPQPTTTLRQKHLPEADRTDTGSQQIRLVVLGSWTFQAMPSPGSFLCLMQNMNKAGRGGITLFQLPAGAATDSNSLAKEALALGYVPLQNDMRVGEKTTSWYRGPFVSQPTKRDFTYGPYHYSDHAMHYDPENGLFNLSYATAWQIGRLLALSDSNFAQQLFEWRRDYFSQLQKETNQQDVEARVANAMALGEEPGDVGAGVAHHMRSFMTAKLGPLAPEMPLVQPREQHETLAHLPGVLSPAELVDMAVTGDDLILTLKHKLKKS